MAMKWSRKLLMLGAGMALLMIVGYLAFRPPREPAYQGRPWSYWVLEYERLQRLRDGNPLDIQMRKQECTQAIRQIGTNALPSLLTYLQYQPPDWYNYNSRSAWCDWLLQKFPALKKPIVKNIERANCATIPFEILGSNAAVAIPELDRIIARLHTNDVVWAAVFALANIGEPALPSLCAALTNRQCCAAVMTALRSFGTNARPALPMIIQYAQDGDVYLRRVAIPTLGRIATEPDLVVPVLTAQLTNSQPDIRHSAAWALGRFGPQASNAVPALVKALNDPDPSVTSMARRSLTNIDMGAYLRANSQ